MPWWCWRSSWYSYTSTASTTRAYVLPHPGFGVVHRAQLRARKPRVTRVVFVQFAVCGLLLPQCHYSPHRRYPHRPHRGTRGIHHHLHVLRGWATCLCARRTPRILRTHACRTGHLRYWRRSVTGRTEYHHIKLVQTPLTISKHHKTQLILGICISFPKMGSALNNYLTPIIADIYVDHENPSNYQNVGMPMFFSFFAMCAGLVCTISTHPSTQSSPSSTAERKSLPASIVKPPSSALDRKSKQHQNEMFHNSPETKLLARVRWKDQWRCRWTLW